MRIFYIFLGLLGAASVVGALGYQGEPWSGGYFLFRIAAGGLLLLGGFIGFLNSKRPRL